MKRDETISGVHTSVDHDLLPSQYDQNAINAIRSEIGDISGEPLGHFNTYMAVAKAVAKYFKVDAEKPMEEFFVHFEGRQITVQTVIIFWMTVFGVGKK